MSTPLMSTSVKSTTLSSTTTLALQNVTLDIPILDVNKSFRKTVFNYCVGGRILQDSNKKNQVSIRALEDLNFTLKSGDKVGLIGQNGAGKTSLLKLLAGVYKPTSGRIKSIGKITPLLTIGTGLDWDDSGEDNISTIGMYLGMTPKEIANNKENIIQFSGLGDFIKLPVRTYSNGMMLRLCFSIATALSPEILLLDEGINAGDAQFAEGAKRRLEDFYNRLDILVVASHSDDLIRQLCNKAMLLEHGRIIEFGEVNEVINHYHSRKANIA